MIYSNVIYLQCSLTCFSKCCSTTKECRSLVDHKGRNTSRPSGWTKLLISWHLAPDRGQEACGRCCQLQCYHLIYLSVCSPGLASAEPLLCAFMYAALTLTFTHIAADARFCTLHFQTFLLPGGFYLLKHTVFLFVMKFFESVSYKKNVI